MSEITAAYIKLKITLSNTVIRGKSRTRVISKIKLIIAIASH